jgi:hypothetical protein
MQHKVDVTAAIQNLRSARFGERPAPVRIGVVTMTTGPFKGRSYERLSNGRLGRRVVRADA